jgi:5-methylcytosine-specific restriction endonuclease McrA
MPTGHYPRKPTSEETKRKIGLANSIALKGRKLPKEVCDKMSKSRMGKKINMTVEGRRRLRDSKIGDKNPMKRLEVREKMSMSSRGRKNPQLSERMKLRTGEKNYNWRGGTSYEPYSLDWTQTLRRSIRERDGYICQMCNAVQSDKALDVHHKDYDKFNCNPDNLVALCHRCHCKTNNHREIWLEYFGIKELKEKR